MAFCSFEEGAALFDCTPVENMFISEYMLRAPGDFVKVYLYALMLCYHDAQRMSLASMARDLDMEEEEVLRAFKYWARDGLVRQTGDNPVRFTLRNIKQMTLTRAENPAEQLYNRKFTEEIRRIMDGFPVGDADYQTVFDWVDVLELPEPVVLMLLQMEVEEVRKRGGERFSFRVADRRAQEWAKSGVRTVEDVERIVVLGRERERELRRLLARLGQRRNPSDDERAMYRKWRDEWGFSADAVQEACRETTKGVPTMAYLDGILTRQHQLGRHEAKALSEGIAKEYTQRDFAREVYAALGRTGVSPTADDLAAIAGWEKDGCDRTLILLAAREAHARSGAGNLEDVAQRLELWRRRGLLTVEQVEAERERVRALNARLREVYAAAGIEKRVCQADRDLLARWTGEMGMNRELVLLAAQYALGAPVPMKAIDRILTDWRKDGIETERAAREEHERHVTATGGGRAPAREPMQRHTYTDEDYEKLYVKFDDEEDA